MYKKYYLLTTLSVSLFFISCKKQHSCQCTTTIESSGNDPYTASSTEEIDGKTTKKRAEQICAHAEKQLNQNTDDYTNPSETLTTSCVLK